ncbi:MAG: 2-C-methyl-D-erythritol 4-phosphate cytidylyltransferase [Armatimonadetes bacterium]|nr:MAG: 2-C-methyl-D-erythritol 4-phosphate cytidylyltransferase [Armatimonadota bacterium]
MVLAAGSGQRYGGPKHELDLGGLPLWKRSVSVLESAGIDTVIVVGPVDGGIPGGARRRDSVAAGLAKIPDSVEWVLIHDAARPLITRRLVATVVDAARIGNSDGVIPALAVTDTLKLVDGDTVLKTVDRSQIAAVQTPQAFRTRLLREAHLIDPEDDATDDAGLIERIGGTVTIVPGDRTNIKITYEGDLELAERLIKGLQDE